MDNNDLGRFPTGRAVAANAVEPVPVSPVPASIPSAEDIPAGPYCYASLSPMDRFGHMGINGLCPHWESREGARAYCCFLNYETETERELLWDQVKICGENDG